MRYWPVVTNRPIHLKGQFEDVVVTVAAGSTLLVVFGMVLVIGGGVIAIRKKSEAPSNVRSG